MDLEELFPELRKTGYKIASPPTREYNCIAWAAGDPTRFWWPDAFETAYWPPGAPRQEKLEAFVRAFETLGYEVCQSPEAEPEWEKVAPYVAEGKPKYAACQLPSGRWTSKIGRLDDIEHDLAGLVGDDYGKPVVYLRRPRRSPTSVGRHGSKT